MFKKLKTLINKPSTNLGLAILCFSLLLLASGITALTGGLLIRGVFDLLLAGYVQYQFWTEWKEKVDA